VIGKTGTATVQIRELDGSTGMRDHAWMVVLVGPEGQRPAYSICVLLEQGGSGGRAAGAVVNQIVHALRAEGYL
jgi:cell division protein FtsI/penicillin-binding protein 2